MEAVRARDLAFLDDLLGEEFTLTTGRTGNEVRGRQEYLDITAERYEIEDFEFEELEVLAYGEAAVVRSQYKQEGRMDGQNRDQTFLMTDVFVWRAGGWRAVTRHVSPLEPGS